MRPLNKQVENGAPWLRMTRDGSFAVRFWSLPYIDVPTSTRRIPRCLYYTTLALAQPLASSITYPLLDNLVSDTHAIY